MIPIQGQKIGASSFDSHEHVCDLINADGPLLSLYTDARDNWLYLWCDTDEIKINRWMLLRLSRKNLIDFFNKTVNLRSLIHNKQWIIILDETVSSTTKTDEFGASQSPTISLKRKFTKISNPDSLIEYWPSEKSFFNPELAEGIDIQQQFSPSKHLIPVNGRWFFKDLDSFSRTYAKLYSFLYSTKPQFINSMNQRLHELLRAPWTGGYSRVNLFSHLRRGLPALHDLQIDSFNYASPGAIEVEALTSICEDVTRTVISSSTNWPQLTVYDRMIDTVIARHKLKKVDLSLISNEELPFTDEEMRTLENACSDICELMDISDRLNALRCAAPNSIVFAKAVQALLRQVEKLTVFQEQGLLNLEKSQAEAQADVRASIHKSNNE